ncbi:radical SAM domain protein [Chitinispirillum alkaliphilum]|nr:radical SAM domain protein [Chitinispirillum alkaliphilum]
MDACEKDVRSNLEQARKRGCKFVDFTGGEPLLHPSLPLFLEHAKNLGFITSVTTNCILFKKRAPQLRGKIDLLHFSVGADNAQTHNRIRGCNSYDSVLESIDIALANKLVPDIQFTYTHENLQYFEGIYSIAREKKLMLILDPVFNTGGEDTIDPEIHKGALSLSKRKGVYLNRAHLLLRSKGGNNTRSPVCRAVSSTIVILPDNSLALPCYHHRITTIPINNNLESMFSKPQWRESRNNQGEYDFCEKCHINCYMDPSFNYHPGGLMFFSLMSKLKYGWRKYFIYKNPLSFKLLK